MDRFLPRQDYVDSDVQYLVSNGVSMAMARAMSCRGVTRDNAMQYVGGATLYHSAMDMLNMTDAVDTINDVIESGGSILIYGDYDADGLSASSLLSLYFSDIGVDNDVIIPTRDMGYGMNVQYILSQFDQKWYDLIITVDCGISNALEVDALNAHFEGAVEIIVTDHHELPELLPNCLCVNPKMGYPFAYLSGSGVAFKVVEALAGRDTAMQYLDLALIGTIADIMPMEDENRSIVVDGLANFNHKSLCKLAQISKCCKPLTLRDIAMQIAPKINAAGRMGDPSVALQVLLSRDAVDTAGCNQLVAINDKRRELTEAICQQAIAMCDSAVVQSTKLVYVYSDSWSHGILGIVASRLKEKYGATTVLLTRDGDNYVGSARSAGSVDLHKLFSSCAEHLVKFGGHKGSVGFSVSQDKVDILRDSFTKALASMDIEQSHAKQYDIAIDGSMAIADLYLQGSVLQPMHPSNNILYFVKGRVAQVRLFGKENNHVQFCLDNGLEVKAFTNYSAFYNGMRCGLEVQILCTLEYDSYSGGVVAMLVDMVATNGVHYDGLYRYNYLANIDTAHVVDKFISLDEACGMIDCDTLVLVDSYSHLQALSGHMDISNFEIDYFSKSSARGGIIVSLADNHLVDKFAKVVAFTSNNIARNYGVKVQYSILCDDSLVLDITISREMCVVVYKALVAKNSYDSLEDTFAKYITGKMTIQQYMACVKVLEELCVVTLVDKYTVEIDSSRKVVLDDSTIYQYLAK